MRPSLSEVGGDGPGEVVGMPTLKMEGSMFLIAEMPDGVVLSFFFSVEVGAVGVSGSARPEEGAGEYGIGRDVGVGGGE